LLGLPAEDQTAAARQVVAKGLTVRQTEALVRQWLNPRREAGDTRANPDIERLQQDLAERIGAEVKIQHGAKGKGKLVISYSSLDELDGVLMHIK
jgi:ParB family chromosome partitioning protein